MRLVTSSKPSRNILLRLEDSDLLPEALAIGLEVEGITTGWLRATGVIADLEIRAGEQVRRVTGPIMAATIESSIVGGRDSIVLRGVFSRDSGASIETFAGELVRARVLAVDVIVTVLEEGAVATAPIPERKAPAIAPAWSAAADASARSPEPSPKPQPVLARTDPMPVPPPKIKRTETDVDQPFPEAGDLVEHFAFGRCEVVKSDGDRLHVKLVRDGRIREIALEMLKVSAMDPVEGHKRFRLDRKI